MSLIDKNIEKDETASAEPLADSQISSNSRIAKNALMLYIRMFVSMVVGLYTSRVVLNTLGVEDYGIYGVVGSVVAMLGFLNSSMAGATSRFITFELGKGNSQRLKDTFSSSMIIHIGIAIVVLIVAETVGLWFLNHKLVIPPHRMYAAQWVYQLSILSAMLTITQVPYNACIIAHERMSVYAYIEILNVTLKLIIVYLLVIGDFDKLILYASLTLVVSIIVMMTYRIYCIRKFQECHFHWKYNKEILRPLLSFSGWDLYGNMCVTVRQQGTNFLINVFFGVVLNAASAVATTLSGTLQGLSNNIIQAFRPQIIKNYANDNLTKLQEQVINAITFSTLFMGFLSIVTTIEVNYMMTLWLGNVPEYAATFCQIILIANLFGLVNAVLCAIIHATGNIKGISVITGSIFLLAIPLIYIAYRMGLPPQWAYIINVIVNLLIVSSNIILVKKQVPQLLVATIIKKTIVAFVVLIGVYFIADNIAGLQTESIIRLFTTAVTTFILLSIITYSFLIDNNTRKNINHRLILFNNKRSKTNT